MTGHPHARATRHTPRDFSRTPLNIYWELTQACPLACRHCRAEAMPCAAPGELTHTQAVAFLKQIPEFGDPVPNLILTGGDPLARPDLFALITEAKALKIPMSITPAASSALTRDVLARLRDAGVDGLGLSLDGSCGARHDAIRQVPGTFDRTLRALRDGAELGMPIQVNTLVSAQTADDLPAIYALLERQPIARWSLFFLIAVGRGASLMALDADEAETLMGWIHATARRAPFAVATTEAPAYRRVALERMRAAGMSASEIRTSPVYQGFAVRDGHGIAFVSHTGDVCPAGFLPLVAGNVTRDSIVDVYRDAPLFKQLHDPNTFHGKCGVCEHRFLCGGSRARAFAATGDPLGTDPLCTYEPRDQAGHHGGQGAPN